MKLLLAISTFFWALSISGQVVNPFDIPKTQSEGQTSASIQMDQPNAGLADTLENIAAETLIGETTRGLSSSDVSSLSSGIITQAPLPTQASNTNPLRLEGLLSHLR